MVWVIDMKFLLHFGPEALHIDMEGHFTFSDSHAFHKMMSAINRNQSREQIEVNVANLKFIDATALRLLMMVHDAAKRAHSCLIFTGAQGQVLSKLSEAAQHTPLRLAA